MERIHAEKNAWMYENKNIQYTQYSKYVFRLLARILISTAELKIDIDIDSLDESK